MIPRGIRLLSKFFGANGAKREVDKVCVILSGKYRLTHETLSEIISVPPSNRAPGVDEVMAEIVELGGEALCGAMLPLYRVILRSGCVPENWSVPGLRLSGSRRVSATTYDGRVPPRFRHGLEVFCKLLVLQQRYRVLIRRGLDHL